MSKFVFVSGNLGKVEWLEKFLDQKVKHHKIDLTEIQSLDAEEVVKHKVFEAYKILGNPVLVEDTSLRFHTLGKLPGTFIKFFLEQIGTAGICQMMQSFVDKSATASVTYGLYDGKKLHIFSAELEGIIPDEPRGEFGMGWDPIFTPNGYSQTYAEMDRLVYEEASVRNRAVQKLKRFLEENE